MKTLSTKRALLASMISLLLCVTMLVGSTFAWFTDTATASVNTIQAGTLDVALEMKDNDGKWVSAEGKTLEFLVDGKIPAEGTKILWEPGCTYSLPELRVVNSGNLALKYKVVLTGINGDAELNDVIEWTIGDAALGTTQSLAPNTTAEFTISGHMKETAGNAYQGKTIDGISITVIATQDAVEHDSNGNTYDEDAPYITVKVANESELRTALYNAPTDGVNGVRIVLTDDITLEMLYTTELYNHSGDAGIAALEDYADGDTLSHYKMATGWDEVSSDVDVKSAFGANYFCSDRRIGRLVVKEGQNVILDLNGKNLSKADGAAHGSYALWDLNLIGNYGTLSLIDSEGTGLITGSGMTSCSPGVIQNFGGELTIRSVNIDGGADYADTQTGQYVIVNGDKEKTDSYKAGTLVLDGVHIYDGATSASLIYNAAGTLTVQNGTELRHVNTKVINVKGGEVIIQDAKIWSNDKAISMEGGKVTIHALTISGSGIIDNKGGTLVDNR